MFRNPGFCTISDAAMQRTRDLAHEMREAKASRWPAFEQRRKQSQSVTKVPVAEGVRVLGDGPVKHYIAWWTYADGSTEEFDGREWKTHKAVAKPVKVQNTDAVPVLLT